MTDVVDTEARSTQLAAVVLGLVLALLVVDLVSDSRESVGSVHLVIESLAFLLSTIGV